jgi:tetratricopeptide (TPR) repeat protein
MCPQDAKGYFNLGETYFALKEYACAYDMYQKTLQLDNNVGEAYLRQAVCLERLGKLDDAINAIHKALNFNLRPEIHQGALQLLNQYKQMRLIRGGAHR